MGATINDITNTGYHIIDTDIQISESLVIGADSTLCFAGGRLINPGINAITLSGQNVFINASPQHIFVGEIEFSGTWLMDRAYPQWFGASNCVKTLYDNRFNPRITDIISDLPDSSVAINKAINLIGRGEVLIPRGFYKLTHFINVPVGIRLIGEGSDFVGIYDYGTILFPWVNNDELGNNTPESKFGNLFLDEAAADPDNIIVKLSENVSFPRCSENAGWANGYMVLVNTADECRYMCNYIGKTGDKYEYTINYIIYNIKQPYPPYGTKICNIGFTDITQIMDCKFDYSYGFMRGVMFNGSLELHSSRVYLLSQVCFSIGRDFADGRSIRNCAFAPATNYVPRDKIYGFDLRGMGDNLDFYNNSTDFNEKIGALHIKSTNGANICDNILNSEVLIEGSKAVNFSSNHCECGMQIDIWDSAVNLSGNFIICGPDPAIKLRRMQFPITTYTSSVVLSNNTFIYYDNTIGWPERCNYVSPYDIVTDGYAIVKMNNCFRTKGTPDVFAGNYLGIQMGKFDLIANTEGNYIWDSGVYYPLPDFNGHSYINSGNCSINQLTVHNMPVKISKPDAFSIDYGIISNIDGYLWLDPQGKTEPLAYQIVVLCDITRKIALYKKDFGQYVTPKGNNDNVEFQISGIYDNAILRLVRKSSQNEFWYVHLHLCGAHKLYDNYSSVSGYEWNSCSGAEMEFNTNIETVTYIGANVECISTSCPRYGEWTNGDMVYDNNPGKEGNYWIFMNNMWVYKN